MSWFVIPSVLLFKSDIYLHFSRTIFIQLHPLQLHVLRFLEGIQFSGMMTLPILRFSAHWPSYQTNPLVQLQLRWVSRPVGPQRWAWHGSSVHSPPNGLMMHSHRAPTHRPGVSSRTSPTDGPVKVIKKSTGLDMCHRSEKTTMSMHEQQTEAVSIMAKTLEVSFRLYFLHAALHL